jgi:hypothetical protein
VSVQSNAKDLFEYIAEVYSIDLPVVRDILKYGDERWWQAELIPSQYCRLRNFDETTNEQAEFQDSGGAWLTVTKSTCDPPPSLPDSLLNWVTLSSSPLKPPKS